MSAAPASSNIHDSPKDALVAYIDELEKSYYQWYKRKQSNYSTVWMSLQALAVVAGLATSVLAAVIHDEYFMGIGWGRIILVILPIVGSFASTLVGQTRAFELASLREQGRETVQYLVSLAKADFAAISDPKDYSQLHRWLVQQIHQLEQEQAVGFLTVASSRQDARPASPGQVRQQEEDDNQNKE